ncbi:MAG TPA: histidine kinase, partial [Calditrichia bacterium]|nr:histidine kinase [Calditrichia bacterium]
MRNLRTPALILLAWTIAGLLYTLQSYLYRVEIGLAVDLPEILLIDASFFLLWSLFTPLILWICRKFPLDAKNWPKNLLVLLLAAVLMAILHRLIYDLIFLPMRATPERPFTWQRLYLSVIGAFDYGLLVCLGVMGIVHGLRYFRSFGEASARNARLEAELLEARLEALQKQLQPHFLFNTLNAIRTLVNSDPGKAGEMIDLLADLLRASLNRNHQQLIPLRSEMALLKKYLDIEQIRFGDRLKIKMNISENTLEAKVPAMILQPLAENAIRHGIAPHRRPGTLSISAEINAGALHLSVEDSGEGFMSEITEGVGLAQ